MLKRNILLIFLLFNVITAQGFEGEEDCIYESSLSNNKVALYCSPGDVEKLREQIRIYKQAKDLPGPGQIRAALTAIWAALNASTSSRVCDTQEVRSNASPSSFIVDGTGAHDGKYTYRRSTRTDYFLKARSVKLDSYKDILAMETGNPNWKYTDYTPHNTDTIRTCSETRATSDPIRMYQCYEREFTYDDGYWNLSDKKGKQIDCSDVIRPDPKNK